VRLPIDLIDEGADRTHRPGRHRRRGLPRVWPTVLAKVRNLAGVEGLEPPAFGFGDRRSTN
jgi:hypothetical protein